MFSMLTVKTKFCLNIYMYMAEIGCVFFVWLKEADNRSFMLGTNQINNIFTAFMRWVTGAIFSFIFEESFSDLIMTEKFFIFHEITSAKYFSAFRRHLKLLIFFACFSHQFLSTTVFQRQSACKQTAISEALYLKLLWAGVWAKGEIFGLILNIEFMLRILLQSTAWFLSNSLLSHFLYV